MAANQLSFNQISTLLNSVANQATGTSNAASTDTSSFVTQAQMVLATGYDNIIGAISQTLGKTIFDIRPYYRKFKGMLMDEQKWGSITRELIPIDKAFEDDARMTLTDGYSIDQYTVNKPEVLQVNYYGQNLLEKSVTIFKDQLDNAFLGPEQFGSFISMVMQNISDQFEQAYEIQARMLLANLIMGRTLATSPGTIVHLVTEYNTYIGSEQGEELTITDLRAPDKFPAFMKWVYAKIATLTAMMTERTHLFHVNITNKAVVQHTPYDRQKVYLLAGERYGMEAQVLADTFHDNYLKFADVETVNFWMSPNEPDKIIAKPSYLKYSDGEIAVADSAVTKTGVFGVIFDEMALGHTLMNKWNAYTPFNAKGGYTNLFYHVTDRWHQNDCRNAIVLFLD